MTRTRLVLSLALVALVALTTARARADQDVHGQVLVVLAQHTEGTVDPRIAEQGVLHQPPFDAFHSMSVLASNDVLVGVGHPATVTLPNGRTLRLELEASTGGRLRVRAQITQANGHDYLPGVTVETDPGVPFVVAGQNYAGGTLVLLVTLGARPATAVRTPGVLVPALRPGLARQLIPMQALPPPPAPPAPAPPAPPAPVSPPASPAPGTTAPSPGAHPGGLGAARKNAPRLAPPPPVAPPPPAGAES